MLVIGGPAAARRPPRPGPADALACRVLCTPEFKVEPTITFTNLFGSPRTIDDGARADHVSRARPSSS